MFKGLKDKLKNAIKGFSSKTEEAATVEEPKEPVEAATQSAEPEPVEETVTDSEEPTEPPKEEPEEPEEKDTDEDLKDEAAEEAEPDEPETQAPPPVAETPVIKKAAAVEAPQAEEETPQITEQADTPEPGKATPDKEKKGFFSRVSEKLTTIQLTEERFEELFWDLELALLENNVAVSVIEKLKEDLREELTTGRTARGTVEERIYRRLEESLREILDQPTIDLLSETDKHQPLVIAAVGVNGSGKTTTLAKLAKYYHEHDKTVVFGACDTFRAAAIQQLAEHAKRLDVPLIKQDYGADPAAVAFDAIKHAEARGINVVLLDTAGRLHSNTNLMDELEKLVRVAKPHRILFVGEAVTGNDCVEQAERFSQTLPVDGIILTKADVDEKGGAAVSMTYVTHLPVVMIATGQGYDDLEAFDPDVIVKNVLGGAR